MPVHTDDTQIQQVTLATDDGRSVEAVVVPVVVPLSEVPGQLTEYRAGPRAPYAAQSKPIARAVLEAIDGWARRRRRGGQP